MVARAGDVACVLLLAEHPRGHAAQVAPDEAVQRRRLTRRLRPPLEDRPPHGREGHRGDVGLRHRHCL